MPKHGSVQDVVEEIYQSVLATPKRQRKLKSKTFWDNFGFKMRTKERVVQVKEALRERSLLVNFDDAVFGTEDRDEWIIISLVAPAPPSVAEEPPPAKSVPTPDDIWFRLIESRQFESEREVEYYFIAPVLEQLGYQEADFAIGFPVQMYEGVKKVNKEADFVLFNGAGRTKQDALLIVEAKKSLRSLTEDAVGQARAYALWLVTPYYFVTNGEELRVYVFRGAVQPDVMLMSFKRSEFREHWVQFYQTLNKDAVVSYKERLGKLLLDA
jgi:hypothetical protein